MKRKKDGLVDSVDPLDAVDAFLGCFQMMRSSGFRALSN
jgi:hypothetical protein